ncbi:uncharacterized protein LOC119102235 [Pollicipes pollicipes]|uniref:uncharacterized protein LOC119102235 n=1 Tax=Pollicipes pollicipes TaxID=41117 RepID=UPI0018856457|nr:uncharacterized protein LOC119102235 [Pollicipes pollicipes]
MRPSAAALLVLCVAACCAMPQSRHRSRSCTYWCKTPTNRFYCCDDTPITHRPPVDQGHQGTCPPVRPFCPRRSLQSVGPRPCRSDFQCGRADKCCYDVCLKQRVCKPAQFF